MGLENTKSVLKTGIHQICQDIPLARIVLFAGIAGSTRMKAGTAQIMILNMLSTIAMIKLVHVYENMMVNLKPTNAKPEKRVLNIVMEITGLSEIDARNLLIEHEWNIRSAVKTYQKQARKE